MPDQNKLKVLHEAGFQIRATCFRCLHFSRGANQWGTCESLRYEHLKHSNPQDGRKASVPIDGWCPNFKMWEYGDEELGAYHQFLEPQN